MPQSDLDWVDGTELCWAEFLTEGVIDGLSVSAVVSFTAPFPVNSHCDTKGVRRMGAADSRVCGLVILFAE